METIHNLMVRGGYKVVYDFLTFYKSPARRPMWGGAAIEYIIVSTFATLFAISSVLFVAHAIKTKTERIEQKLGVKFEDSATAIFE